MSPAILTYFGVMNKGFGPLMCLENHGMEWEGKSLTEETWEEVRKSGVCPFGQIPILECGEGVVVAQSAAIMQYVGRKVAGAGGACEKEAAVSDMLIGLSEDFWNLLSKTQPTILVPKKVSLEENAAFWATTIPEASSIRDDSSDDTRLYIHGMGHQKHVIKLMQDAGVRKVSKTEEIPWGEGEETNAICFLHKTAGCDCGAAWRCIPRQFLSMLGGKVAMEKLFRTYGLSEIYPKTFINLQEYLRGREEHNTPGKASKWFVKVSHMNSRKMMICSTDSDEISEHVESFPSTYKYVIQKEVENPLLIDGHKTLLRLWVLVTYHPDGTAYLHFSRRLRLNKLQAEYDVDSSSAEADLCHKTSCIYKDASKWPLYRKMWSQCVDVAELIIKTVMKKWLERPGFGPPESGGLYNIFAMDYVPTEDGQAVLIEANVDPGFKNKCPETKLAAEDLVAFFFLPVLTSGSFTIPDRNFHTVTIEAKQTPSGPSPPDADADMEECGDE